MPFRHDDLVQLLRRRLLDALRAGELKRGDRLGSTRTLSAELGVNLRAIMAAYQTLAAEGLVDVRPRSGIYVATTPHGVGELSVAAERWLADMLADGVARHLPVTEVGSWADRATRSATVHAAVVAGAVDMAAGICEELRADFAIEGDAILLAELEQGGPVPERLSEADVVVTIVPHVPIVRPLADRLGLPLVALPPIDELIGAEWRCLLREQVYMVVTDPRLEATVRQLLAKIEGVDDIRYLVVGRDDLWRIPPDAHVYVTRIACLALAGQPPLPGRPIPAVRLVREAGARELTAMIVRKNLAAWRRVRTRQDDLHMTVA
ncbi:MAG TPA: GntR family transcriptional regulator [Gemmatimonadaceae bacterium]|nr:GntR family transcriptional regulator [Gemmatimonadaceae bacterium]